jgi:toxin-antitoxin system PIN domain toxin
MILLDANILIYADNRDAAQHLRARTWLESAFQRTETVGLTWPALWAYLRVLTNRRVSPTPDPGRAFQFVRALISHPRANVVEPGPRHAEILEDMVMHGQATGPDVSDAVLAAIAIEHGATLASTDRDFARFKRLRWLNPLD